MAKAAKGRRPQKYNSCPAHEWCELYPKQDSWARGWVGKQGSDARNFLSSLVF